jgi:GNAT superfamily N-acetyltransferase
MSQFYLRVGTLADLHRIYPRMRRDFHAYERMPELFLARAIRRGAQELLLLTDETGREAGYAICCTRSLYGYVLLNYLAMDPARRGSGAGSAALALLAKRYEARQGVIIELTDTPGEEADTVRRRRFYGRAGFVPVDCAYSLGGHEAFLMVKPLRGTADIGRAAKFIMPEIYSWSMPRFVLEHMAKVRAE